MANELLDYLYFKRNRLAFAREVAPALGIETFDPWQERFLSSRSKRIILNCSRQSGKSTLSAICCLHRTIYWPNSLVLVFSPSKEQSLELFRFVAQAYRASASEELPDVESLTKTGLELKNGSRIQARPGSSRSARGRTASLIVVDEAAYIAPELYDSIAPMLATTAGDLYLLSTPAGRQGIFYEAWEYGGDEWERYEVSVWDVPRSRIPLWFIERERRERPAHVFAREYENSFDEVGGTLFPRDLFESAITYEEDALEFPNLAYWE